MKYYALVIMMLLGALNIDAQTTVKGVIQDSLTHEGEPYATVRIYGGKEVNAQSTPLIMGLTDLDGNFAIILKEKGEFTALCSSTGKNTIKRIFTANGEKEIDLGTMLTSDMESVMQAMEVVAQKPIVKMEPDKVSYSVQDDVDSRSMSVLDMLRKVPMVAVDGQDNITVNGQSSFKVYVDGKPNMMLSSNPSQILKAMPASMVSSIEVVTSPGAKYDAEGAGGILNINTANATAGGGTQDMSGFNGSITAQGGNRGGGAGVTIAGQQKKLSYSADFNYHYIDNGEVSVDNIREQFLDENDPSKKTVTDYMIKSRNKLPFIMGDFALGYNINNENQIGMNFGITKYTVNNSGNPTTSITSPYGNSFFEYYTKVKMGSTDFNGSVDYTHFFDKEHKNSLTAIYQISHAPGTRYNETLYPQGASTTFNDLITDGDNCTSEHVGQVDVINTLGTHSKLNYGGKYTLRNNSSEYYDLNDNNKVANTDYEHRDQIAAAYVESENSWDKWSAKAGVRYEHTWVKMNDFLNHNSFTKNYGNVVPSVTLSHTMGAGQNIGLTYNMRISRPGITYLNPYVDKSEPTTRTYGNIDLKAEKTNNIGLTYSLYTPKIIISSSLREAYSKGGIEQYSFYDNNGLMNTTFGNIADRSLTSLNVYAQWSMTKTTRIILNGALVYNYLKSDELDLTNKGWSANAMLNVQQTLPKEWTLSAIVMSNSKTYTLQGKNSGMNLGVLSITKQLLKDRLSLTLTGITGLSKGGKIHLDQTAKGKDFISTTKISVPLTRVQFTAQWTFGNTGKQFQKHQNKVQDDYIEHKSSTENIGNAGSM